MLVLQAGWTQGFVLLIAGVMALVYFAPSLWSFRKAQKRFYLVLALNLVLSPLQAFAASRLVPQWLVIDAAAPLQDMAMLVLVNLGPGWLLLLAWVLTPDAIDPRLARARQTKWFDLLAGLPLVIWFGAGVLRLRPILADDVARVLQGDASLLVKMQVFALTAAMGFNLLLVWLLLVRDKPVRRGRAVWGRVAGFAGTFMGVGILQLPVPALSLAMQTTAAAMVGIGSLASLLVLWRLGASFSIMPEARRLVTSGPYAWARHPLYAVEMVTIIGTALQFQQPWAGVIAAGVLALLVVRSHYEEQVLEEAYPEYAGYRARTARFIPRII